MRKPSSPAKWTSEQGTPTIATEIKNIPGYTKYNASSVGEIYRVGGTHPLKKAVNKHGYFMITVTRDSTGERVTMGVHRLVALAWYGPMPVGYVTDHIDRNRQNNTPNNLRYINKSDNRQNSDWSKTKIDDFLAIRNGVENGATYADMARKFKLSETSVRYFCGNVRFGSNDYPAIDYTPKNKPVDNALRSKILAEIEQGIPQVDIARKYGLVKSTITKIKQSAKG